MCTVAVVERGGVPLSLALTVSSNRDLLRRSSSLATVIVPRTGSMANEFAKFPVRQKKKKKIIYKKTKMIATFFFSGRSKPSYEKNNKKSNRNVFIHRANRPILSRILLI